MNSVALTLDNYREMTRDAFDRLRQAGDNRLLLFEGPDLLGPDDPGGMSQDGVHPNGDGYELIGQRAAETVLPALLAMRKSPRG